MFNKIRSRLLTVEILLDALLSLLIKKEVFTHSEMQIELLTKAQEQEQDEQEGSTL